VFDVATGEGLTFYDAAYIVVTEEFETTLVIDISGYRSFCDGVLVGR